MESVGIVFFCRLLGFLLFPCCEDCWVVVCLSGLCKFGCCWTVVRLSHVGLLKSLVLLSEGCLAFVVVGLLGAVGCWLLVHL